MTITPKMIEAGWDVERHVLHSVAAIIDHPSVYMGGPSRDAKRKAEAIIEFFRTDPHAAIAMEAFGRDGETRLDAKHDSAAIAQKD